MNGKREDGERTTPQVPPVLPGSGAFEPTVDQAGDIWLAAHNAQPDNGIWRLKLQGVTAGAPVYSLLDSGRVVYSMPDEFLSGEAQGHISAHYDVPPADRMVIYGTGPRVPYPCDVMGHLVPLLARYDNWTDDGPASRPRQRQAAAPGAKRRGSRRLRRARHRRRLRLRKAVRLGIQRFRSGGRHVLHRRTLWAGARAPGERSRGGDPSPHGSRDSGHGTQSDVSGLMRAMRRTNGEFSSPRTESAPMAATIPAALALIVEPH